MTESHKIENMEKDALLSNLLGALATSLATQIEQSIAARLDLRSHTAAAALVTVFNHPGDTIDILKKSLSLTHSGAVRLVDGLEKDGLLVRTPNEADKRSVLLNLTAEGKAVAREVLEARAKAIDVALVGMGHSDKSTIIPLLEDLLANLTDGYDGARRNCRLCDEGVCRPAGCPVERASGHPS